MSTHKLASEAVNAALRCSNYRPDDNRLKDVYADAVEAEIALIYSAIYNGMNPENHARARETLKQLMKNGRRYSYSTALEQAA